MLLLRGESHAVLEVAVSQVHIRDRCAGVLIPAVGASARSWGALRLPLDLGSGCALGVSADLVTVAFSANDARGEVRFRYAFPDDPRLRGAVFYSQILVLDRRGIVSTRVLRQRLGGRPRASVCSSLTSAGARSGVVIRQAAPIWRLQ